MHYAALAGPVDSAPASFFSAVPPSSFPVARSRSFLRRAASRLGVIVSASAFLAAGPVVLAVLATVGSVRLALSALLVAGLVLSEAGAAALGATFLVGSVGREALRITLPALTPLSIDGAVSVVLAVLGVVAVLAVVVTVAALLGRRAASFFGASESVAPFVSVETASAVLDELVSVD